MKIYIDHKDILVINLENKYQSYMCGIFHLDISYKSKQVLSVKISSRIKMNQIFFYV